MPTIPINGTVISYEDTGPREGAETILFSHGLLWSSAMWAAQVAEFRDRYRCVAYDHRGQGRSAESTLKSIGMDGLADDAAALIEALGLGPVHVCGLSMGGFVGMRLAAWRPDLVLSLALLDTTARTDPFCNALQYRLLNLVARVVGLSPVAGQVLRIMIGRSTRRDPERAGDMAAWRAQIVGNRPSFWRAVNGVLDRQDFEPELHRISAPTLVLVGAEDEPFPPSESVRLRERIANARLVEIPACGHMSNLEQPKQVNAAIRSFLNGVQVADGRVRRSSVAG